MRTGYQEGIATATTTVQRHAENLRSRAEGHALGVAKMKAGVKHEGPLHAQPSNQAGKGKRGKKVQIPSIA